MNRRDFLKWMGGGVAAVAALSASQVLDAEKLFNVTGAVDPESLLWLPDEKKIILPPEKPLIIERAPVAGVGAYRVTIPRDLRWTTHYYHGAASYTERVDAGVYWLDGNFGLVDAFDLNGQPRAVLDGTGPDVRRIKRIIRDWWGHDDRVIDQAGMIIHRWPELLYAADGRPVLAHVRLGPTEAGRKADMLRPA